MADRCVLHVDMDAFYASVEQRDNPELRGKPLVVGGTGNRGVVAAASYESRRFGVRSAMPMREARRRCPELLAVRPRMAIYKSVSRQVFDVFRRYSPIVEGLSLDEAFIDVTGSLSLFGDGEQIARHIKADILQATGLTASVGVADNKLVAKIASDLDKPDGLVVVRGDSTPAILDPLDVAVIPGIGRETLARLHQRGIRTVADLRQADDAVLRPVFGRYTDKTRARAAGIDDRPVEPDRDEKSISAEETFDRDLETTAEVERALLKLAERATTRMRRAGLQPGTIHVKIRESDFTTHTRQMRLRPPSASTDVVYSSGRKLVAEWRAQHTGSRLRLLGIGGSDLSTAGQQDLFAEDANPDHVDETVDRIRERFGDAAVGRARSLDTPE
ncbi:MAG: DNA polymerase IV [Pseudomonadota bacterium]